MSIYDPQQPQEQQPYPPQPQPTFAAPTYSGGNVGALDTQPTASGDRWALVAITVVGMTLLSCVPGLNCLSPLVPLIVGVMTLMRANTAVDPQRARTFGWIATALGGLILLAAIAIAIFYGAAIISVMNEIQNNPGMTAP